MSSLPASSPLLRSSMSLPAFGGYTRAEMRQRLTEEGVPPRLHAGSKCYSGRKDYDFPVSPHLDPDRYPDITEDLNELKAEIIAELKEIRARNPVTGLAIAMRTMAHNFPTGEPWDTKYLPKFPGRDRHGRTQYALYKGKVVSANYISNNLYAQITASLGLPLWFSRMAAKMDACGIAEIIFKRKMPEAELRQFRDTPEDQDAIISAYDDYHHDDPWRRAHIDPKRPYPADEADNPRKRRQLEQIA